VHLVIAENTDMLTAHNEPEDCPMKAEVDIDNDPPSRRYPSDNEEEKTQQLTPNGKARKQANGGGAAEPKGGDPAINASIEHDESC